jgi:MFS family permease
VAILSLAVGALTPVGPRLLASPFQVSEITHYINEWQPASVTNPILIGVLVLAAIPLLAGLRGRERMPWRTILLLGLGVALALLYSRTIAVGAAIVAPLAAHTMRNLLPREPITRREGLLTGVLATGSLVVAGVIAAGTAGTPGLGPNDLDKVISALPTGTVVCNEQADGGWLIYKHPNVRVTMDTRVEIYSTDHIDGYLTFLRAAPGWQEYPQRLGCQYSLLDVKDPVVEALARQLGWSPVAKTVDRVLLRAPQ